MFIIEYLKVILWMLYYLSGLIGVYVLAASFFGNMEIVYKAKILDSPPTPMWERVLNRLAWGLHGLYTVHRVLVHREHLYRSVMLMETKEYAPRGPEDDGPVVYAASTHGYSPMPGTILVFHGNSEEEGEPLYVLRPFEFLADDWRTATRS